MPRLLAKLLRPSAKLVIMVCALALAVPANAPAASRIKDIVDVEAEPDVR